MLGWADLSCLCAASMSANVVVGTIFSPKSPWVMFMCAVRCGTVVTGSSVLDMMERCIVVLKISEYVSSKAKRQ